MLGAALSWARAHGKALGVGGGFVGIGAAYAWNGSESWRMARAIRNGQFGPEKLASFQEDFCVFDLNGVQRGLKGNGIVCLIGLQATGKTTTVTHLLGEATNPFFLKISHDDVHGAIYKELRNKVWKLPWLAAGLRVDAGKDPETIVTEVFKKVQDMTGKPVHLGFDVVEESKQNPVQDSRAIDALRAVQKEHLEVPASFDAKLFVKRVKYLCADRHVAKALFSTSEGLQVMAVAEPRLRKFMGQELDINKAKKYLEHIGTGGDYTDEMLGRIPRTFEKLRELAEAPDKEVFCKEAMDETRKKIKESKKRVTEAKAKPLFKNAVQEAIDITDVYNVCASEQEFVQIFVKTNVFGPAPGGRWQLQFDCTAVAAKEVFGL